ncbi:DUF2510 domain-containing protein [Streptomyces sp. SP17BM10]|uniref:DUF2510 domain-containing protein n=1 Tax=Streptomyces sp. SP17BM10 TaxID=3002530 RepID=UPI002E7A4FB3|nr:DUF2510 domain-containing protein [Streptomyces sp. SP17BM10]MEE1785199.1 DUF2510 domain-containing protein [Streptomyces sp. SP17BM10]
MSNSTPPGWYPVPGADGAPHQERWWDGNAWTSEVRPLQGGAAQVADAPTQTWQSPGPSAQGPGQGYGYGTPQDAPPGYGYPGGRPPAPGYGYPGQAPGQGYGAPEYGGGYGAPEYGQGYGGQEYGPGYPGAQPPGYGYPPPPRSGGVKPGVVIGVAAAVLVVGAVITGLALSGGSPSADPTPNPTVPVTKSQDPAPSPTYTLPTTVPTPTQQAPKPAPVLKSTVPDAQHAITVPVFEGWEAQADGLKSTVYLGSGRYTCPDGNNTCIRGQFAVQKDTVQGATAKAAAEAAMPDYAGAIFTGITSHTDSGSGYVTVAGVLGYASRWHVRTSDGTQGYVLLATVPAKGGGFVVFEGGVDDDPAAPDASVLDQILRGIKQDGSAGPGSTT